MQSLKTCLTFLHTPDTPSLIRAAAPAALALVQLTTPARSPSMSETRFERLCALLGDGLIGSVWIYASRDLDALEASLDVLPEIVTALDIGATRYLKASAVSAIGMSLIITRFGLEMDRL